MAIRNPTIKITVDDSDLKRAQKDSKNVFQQTNKAIKVQQESIEDLTKELKDLEKQRDKSNDPKKIKTLNRAIKDQKAVISDLKGETKNLEKQGSKSFFNLSKAAKQLGSVLLATFAVSNLIRFTKQLNQTAIQMEAFETRARVVFGAAIGQVKRFAEANALALGLTRNEFLGAAAAIGDLLVPLGVTRQRAAEMSTELVKLGSNLKIFTGDQRSAAEISSIVARALTGEVEGLKALGVSVAQNSKEFKDLIKVKMEDEGMTLLQAKAVAIYETVLQRANDALKSAEENTDSLALKQQELNATWREINETLAEGLTPSMNTFSTSLLGLTKNLTNQHIPVWQRFLNLIDPASAVLDLAASSLKDFEISKVTEDLQELTEEQLKGSRALRP